MTTDITTMAAQYGLAGFMALVVGWIGYRIGLRLIKAIDDQATSNREAAKELALEWRQTATAIIEAVQEHTRLDIEYHNDVQQELAGMRARIDTALELTPVEGRRIPPRGEYSEHRPKVKSAPRGVPIGVYGPRKPPRDDSDE